VIAINLTGMFLRARHFRGEASIYEMTIMATAMPFVGRGWCLVAFAKLPCGAIPSVSGS
jgi:hypothetical protein